MKIVKNIVLAIALIANVPTWCAEANGDINQQNAQCKLDKYLLFATINGNTAAMRDLLAQGANPDYSLTIAVQLPYNIDKIALLACAGANLSDQELERVLPPGYYALTIAIEEREKNPGDCKQCEENCAKRFKECGLYAAIKKKTTK